jgi:hypothetical protein
VDVAEFQRAAQVLTALQVRERASAHDHASVAHPYLSHPIFDSSHRLDLLTNAAWTHAVQSLSGAESSSVGGEIHNPGQCNAFTAWGAPDSALGVVLAKEPNSLTSEDALTAACAMAPFVIHWSAGWDKCFEPAGITFPQMMGQYMPAMFMMQYATTNSDDRNMILCPLLLELLASPEKLPTFAMVGVVHAFHFGIIGRPVLAAKLLKEHDAIGVLMGILRKASPSELVAFPGFSRRPYGAALPAMRDLVENHQANGMNQDLTTQLLSCGFIDVVVAALSAVESVLVAEKRLNEGVVVYGLLGFLSILNDERIDDAVRAIPSALRCVKDSKASLLADVGLTASSQASLVAANLWGKDEDNPFGFARKYY